MEPEFKPGERVARSEKATDRGTVHPESVPGEELVLVQWDGGGVSSAWATSLVRAREEGTAMEQRAARRAARQVRAAMARSERAAVALGVLHCFPVRKVEG